MGPRVRQRHRNDGGRDAGLGARIKLTASPSKRHGEPEKLALLPVCLSARAAWFASHDADAAGSPRSRRAAPYMAAPAHHPRPRCTAFHGRDLD
jgi:hypothetical protein